MQGWVDLWSLLNKCKKRWYEAKQGMACRFLTLQKVVVASIPRLLDIYARPHFLNIGTSITPQSPLWGGVDLTNQTNTTNQLRRPPTHGLSNHVRIHAAHNREHGCQNSFTLCRGCTHFPWVVAILNSRILIIQTSTLTHLWCVH
jgi:hypothetical protein